MSSYYSFKEFWLEIFQLQKQSYEESLTQSG